MQLYRDLRVLTARPDRRGPGARAAPAVRRPGCGRSGVGRALAASWRGRRSARRWRSGGPRSWSAAPGCICMPCCMVWRRFRTFPPMFAAPPGRGSPRSVRRHFMPSSPGCDPAMAARLRPTDRQRLLRAYEVVVGTGRSLAAWQADAAAARQLAGVPRVGLALVPPRPALYERIDAPPARHDRAWRPEGAEGAGRALAARRSAL